MSKAVGLYKKYNVDRVDGKPVGDCIVLELKDEMAQFALRYWADLMYVTGKTQVRSDLMKKLEELNFDQSKFPDVLRSFARNAQVEDLKKNQKIKDLLEDLVKLLPSDKGGRIYASYNEAQLGIVKILKQWGKL